MIYIPLPIRLYMKYRAKGKLVFQDVKDTILEDFYIIR